MIAFHVAPQYTAGDELDLVRRPSFNGLFADLRVRDKIATVKVTKDLMAEVEAPEGCYWLVSGDGASIAIDVPAGHEPKPKAKARKKS